MRQWFAILSIAILILGLGLNVTTAQETPTPVITAEVIYPEVNLRVGASQRYNSLALLPLLPDAATLGSLAVTVPQTASLQITAWDSLELASGSSVTLLGRNFEGTSFWAESNSQKGWLEVEELTFQREFNYLPIID